MDFHSFSPEFLLLELFTGFIFLFSAIH